MTQAEYPAWMIDPPEPRGPYEYELPCFACGVPVSFRSMDDEYPEAAEPIGEPRCSNCGAYMSDDSQNTTT